MIGETNLWPKKKNIIGLAKAEKRKKRKAKKKKNGEEDDDDEETLCWICHTKFPEVELTCCIRNTHGLCRGCAKLFMEHANDADKTKAKSPWLFRCGYCRRDIVKLTAEQESALISERNAELLSESMVESVVGDDDSDIKRTSQMERKESKEGKASDAKENTQEIDQAQSQSLFAISFVDRRDRKERAARPNPWSASGTTAEDEAKKAWDAWEPPVVQAERPQGGDVISQEREAKQQQTGATQSPRAGETLSGMASIAVTPPAASEEEAKEASAEIHAHPPSDWGAGEKGPVPAAAPEPEVNHTASPATMRLARPRASRQHRDRSPARVAEEELEQVADRQHGEGGGVQRLALV